MDNHSEPVKTLTIQITGYKSMGIEMDKAFISLYAGFLSHPFHELDDLLEKLFPDFEKATITYFTKNPITDPVQDDFINNFTPIWNGFRSHKQLGKAQLFWQFILGFIVRLESHFHTRIHKGSIYYFWGGTAITNGELEKGYSLIHSALIEDIETYKNPNPDTPAFRFVFLDYKDSQQQFIDLLSAQGKLLESYLAHYCSLSKSKFDSSSFQKRFLACHPKPEAILLLAYTIARIEQRLRFPQLSTDNIFSGLLDMNLLFDLVLVIDNSIQAKYTTDWRYFNLARFLSDTAKLDLTQIRLEAIKTVLDDPSKFEQLVIDLLNSTFPMPDGGKLSILASAIAVSFCIRNYAAHNIASESLLPAHSQELIETLFDVLFLTAESLY